MINIPYAEALAGREPVQVLRVSLARWTRLLDRYSDADADLPTAPGKWSVREIATHMADCEIAWSWRLRQAYAEPHAQMQPFDQDAWARAYGGYTFAEAKATLTALRTWNLAFLQQLSEDDKRKPVFHPERGEETLWTIVEIMAGHDLHHLERLDG